MAAALGLALGMQDARLEIRVVELFAKVRDIEVERLADLVDIKGEVVADDYVGGVNGFDEAADLSALSIAEVGPVCSIGIRPRN